VIETQGEIDVDLMIIGMETTFLHAVNPAEKRWPFGKIATNLCPQGAPPAELGRIDDELIIQCRPTASQLPKG
jgi:hypothetical protein